MVQVLTHPQQSVASGCFRCFTLELRHWCAPWKDALKKGNTKVPANPKVPTDRCDSHVLILRCSLLAPLRHDAVLHPALHARDARRVPRGARHARLGKPRPAA